MTDTEHNDETAVIEGTAEVSEEDTESVAADDAAGSADESDAPEPARPLPSPKTARLSYCAFAEMRPSPKSRYAPMSIPGYIAVLVLTAIPAAGLIIAAVLSIASKKVARRRLAIAILLIQTVLIAAAGTLVIVSLCLDVDFYGMLLSFIGQ